MTVYTNASLEFSIISDTALVPSPTAGQIRSNWIKIYHEQSKKLAKLRRDWNAFENDARIQYQRWYYHQFAKSISDLTLETERANEIKLILNAVRAQIEVNNLSRKQAFLYVMEKLNTKADPFPNDLEVATYLKKERLRFKHKFDTEHGETGEEGELPSEVQDIFSDQGSESQRSTDENIFTQDPSAPSKSNDIKFTYRKIVRLLHPDRGTDMTPDEKALWNETQNAYLASDIAALLIILLKLENGGTVNIHAVESIGEIIDITTKVILECKEIGHHRNQIRKEYAYRFWASRNHPKNRNKLILEVRSNLSFHLLRTEVELKELKLELQRLKRACGLSKTMTSAC